jgi:hypothetical protein
VFVHRCDPHQGGLARTVRAEDEPALVGLHAVLFDEVFGLFCKARREDGGLGFVSDLVREGALRSHAYYQVFIDHYDVDASYAPIMIYTHDLRLESSFYFKD